MRYLVDDSTQQVRFGFQFPIRSSVAGHFVVDVPDELGVTPASSVLTDLVNAKKAAYQAAHPNLANGVHNDEFLSATTIYTTQSDGYIAGPNKRIAILPGGHLQTVGSTLTGSFTKIFLHFGVFTTFQDSPDIGADYPGPSRTLFDWDTGLADFVEPDPSLIQVSLKQASNNDTLATLFSDSVVNYSGSGLGFRLEFLNTSADKVLYLSDYYLLWG
jgi:hypothetical protein